MINNALFSGCLRNSLNILDYYKNVIFIRILNLAIANSLASECDIDFDFLPIPVIILLMRCIRC